QGAAGSRPRPYHADQSQSTPVDVQPAPLAWLREVHRKQKQFAESDVFRSRVARPAAAPLYPADREAQTAIVQNLIARRRLPWNRRASAWARGDRCLQAQAANSIFPPAQALRVSPGGNSQRTSVVRLMRCLD